MADVVITDELLDEIERKAKEANAGPWKYRPVYSHDAKRDIVHDEVTCVSGHVVVEDVTRMEDAFHIARMDPPTTLALVARIRELEQEISYRDRRVREVAERAGWLLARKANASDPERP